MNTFLTNKEDIIDWLDKNKVKNYTLRPDDKSGYVVDIDGEVHLESRFLTSIPVKFNIVKGYFSCSYNELTNLEFCPQILTGSFHCSNNQLTSLEFCPKIVSESFFCYDNKLTSLEFCPQQVGGNFNCYGNISLGELQNIHDFSVIYQEHKKFLIEKLAGKLTNELNINNLPSKSTKIKI